MSPGGDTAHRAGAPDWHQAWTCALEELELDVVEAERLLATGRDAADGIDIIDRRDLASWRPPVIGPLPVDLRARAEAILARQLRVADDLARMMGANRREVEVARRMTSGTLGRRQSVFVDSDL